MGTSSEPEAVSSPADLQRWSLLSHMPTVARFGIVGVIYHAIENKFDARSLVAVATALFAVLATAAWVFGLGRDLISFATTCQNLTAAVSWTSIATIAVLSSIIVIYFVIHWRRRRTFLNSDRHSEFKILQRASLCHVMSPQQIDYYYRYVVKARRAGISSFSMRFMFRGKGKSFKAYLKNPKFRGSFPDDSDWKFQEFLVEFNRVLEKGEEEIIEYCFSTLTEPGEETVPVIAISIGSAKYPRFNTSLTVMFDDDVDVAAIYRRRYFSVIADKPITSKVVSLDEQRSHRWRIPVRPGWRFAIRWVYG